MTRGPAPVLLAAGASRRLGEPKALAEIAGRRVVDLMLQELGRTGGLNPGDELVVTGAHDGAIRSHLARTGQSPEVLTNPHWARGRTSSVQAAVQARPGRDLLIWPVDVPLVGSPTLGVLLDEWRELAAPALGWLAPLHGGEGAFGHPVLIGRDLAQGALVMSHDEPLRHLRQGASLLASVQVSDAAILDDLDTPEDLAALRRRVEEFGQQT